MTTLMEAVVTMKPDFEDFEKQASGGIETAMGKAAATTDRYGKTLTRNVTLPILAVGGAVFKASTDFNSAMANVAALGVPQQRVEEMKKSIQDLSVTTAKSTTDLADGMYNVVSAFGDGADSMAILETNARAAVAGLATTTDAINLTSAVTKAYGDTSAEAVDRVANLALKTVEMGQTTFPELAASIGRVTPLTNELGVSQEELFGVMATFTGVTGGAAEVSTQLRGVLQALMSPTKEMTDYMALHGYASGQAMIESEGLQGAILGIAEYAQQAGVPLSKMIGSIEGQTLALAGSGEMYDTWTQKSSAMEGNLNTLDEAWKAQTEGVNAAGFQMAQARQEAAVAAQQLGDALAPAITQLVEAVTPLIGKVKELVDWFTSLDESQQQTIFKIIGLVAALGPALVVIAKLINAVKVITSVVKLMNLAFLANPITLVIAAIAVLGLLLWKYRDQIKEWIGNVVNWFKGLGEKLSAPFQKFKDFISNIFKGVLNIVKSYVNMMIGMWEKVINGPMNAANTLIRVANKVPGVNIPLLPTVSIPRLADGGDITRGGTVMVGEEGPEYLNLPAGARVTPLDKAGTTNITMNVTVQGGNFDEERLAAALDRMARRAAATSGYRRPE